MQHRAVAHPKERHGSHDARMPVDNLLPVVDQLVQCRKHKQSADVNIVTSQQHLSRPAQCLQTRPRFDTVCCAHMQNTVEATVTLS